MAQARTPSATTTALIAGASGGFCAGVLDVVAAWPHLSQFVHSFLGKVSLSLQVGALYGGAGAVLSALAAGLFGSLVRFTHFGTFFFPAMSRDAYHTRGEGGPDGRLALTLAWLVSGPMLLRPVLGIAASTIASRHNPTLILAAIICAVLAALVATVPVTFIVARLIVVLFRGRPAGPVRTRLREAATPLLAPPLCLAVVIGWLLADGWSTTRVTHFPSLVLVGVGYAGCTGLWFLTHSLWGRILDSHRCLRDGRSRGELTLVSSAVAAVLATAVAVLVAVVVGRVPLHRNPDPVSGSQFLVGLTILLIWGAIPLAASLAWVLDNLMRRTLPLAWQHALAHPNGPYVAAAIVVGGMAIALAVVSRTIVPLLHLRPEGALGIWIAGTVLFRPLATRMSKRTATWGRWSVLCAEGLLVTLLWAGGLSLASDSAGIKAANAWSGLTSPLLAAIRRVADRDGDGFAAILGGGDCNDRDSGIHPLAFDLPGDGIDQNCTGADAPSLPSVGTPLVGRARAVPAGLNVLLITIDCVRAGHVGIYGYRRDTTPSLDALARESVVFDHARSNSSFTMPSIATIMTGRQVSQIRWSSSRTDEHIIADDNGTIGAVMRRAGAETGAVVWSPGPLSRKLGFDNGFDEFIAPTGISPKDGWSESSTTGSVVLLSKASLAKEQADIAIRWMADQREHRFFLWVHFIDTHPPYNHHAGVVEFGLDQDSAADHELRFTDSQIGRILAWLKESGIGERTAVFVTSDHGTYHGRHQLPPQGRYLYSDYTRIPLIVHIPGVHAGRVSDPVSHVDLLPTIAQIAGIPIGIPLPGTSLLPIIADEPRSHSPRPIFQVVSLGDQERRAVVEGCSLMIHNILPELTFERYDTCNPGTELLQDQYDPVRDANLRNLLLRLEDANQVPLPAWTP